MSVPFDPISAELEINYAELRVLIAVITHCQIYQRPIARCRELLEFMVEHGDIKENHASCATTRLIKRGFLQIVGRNSVFGGEHLLQHTPRGERLLGLQVQCAAARDDFWAAIRGESRHEAA